MCIARFGGPEPLSSYRYQSEGGQKGKNVGRIGFVGALFEGVSLPVHWRLASLHSGPRPVLCRPLSTTFAHILRLTGLLSTRKLRVLPSPPVSLAKARWLGANSFDDHKGLRLRT